MNGMNGMEQALPQRLPPQLAALQAQAGAAFARQGLPQRTQEDWHYTDLRRFWPADPAIAGAKADLDVPPRGLVSQLAGQLGREEGAKLVYRNKQFHLPSAPPKKSAGELQLRPLGEALAASPSLSAKWGARARADIGAAMAGLNLAALDAGFYVAVGAGEELDLCVEWQGGGQARLVIELGAGARLNLHETSESGEVQNLVLDGFLARGALLAHRKAVRARASHISAARFELRARAQLDQQIALLGKRAGAPRLTRHETHLRFQGEGARARLRGYDLAAGRHQSELVFASQHARAGGAVDMRSCHVLWDDARAVFHGQVEIAPHAVASDATQKARALLRSPNAEMNARPELAIHADDVVCAHGVSIGELDADALFYMRQRGLDLKSASQILLEAFLCAEAAPTSLWTRQEQADFHALLLSALRRLERGHKPPTI